MIKIVKYSDKSLALFGEQTKDIKDKLKSIGGRFNPFLKDPESEGKKAGWIFQIKKEEEIVNLLNGESIEFELNK